MHTIGAPSNVLSTLHPNTILKPNLDSNAHPDPQPTTPNPTPNPTPAPNPNRNCILGPRSWGKDHRLGDFNDK